MRIPLRPHAIPAGPHLGGPWRWLVWLVIVAVIYAPALVALGMIVFGDE